MLRTIGLAAVLTLAACTSGSAGPAIATSAGDRQVPARERAVVRVVPRTGGYGVRLDSCDRPGTVLPSTKLTEHRLTPDGRILSTCSATIGLRLGSPDDDGTELGRFCPPLAPGVRFDVIVDHGDQTTSGAFRVQPDGNVLSLSPGC